jgi:hypothetical protein
VKKFLKIVLAVLIVVVLLLAAAGIAAYRNAARIAAWAAERALPGASVQVGSLRVSWNGADVGQVRIADKAGEPVVSFGSARVGFKLAGLWRGQLDEIALNGLEIRVSQDAGGVWNAQKTLRPASAEPKQPARPLRIGRLSIESGKVVVGANAFTEPFGPIRFSVRAKDIDSARPLSAKVQATAQLDSIRVADPAGKWAFAAEKIAIETGWQIDAPTQVRVEGLAAEWRGKKLAELPRASVEIEPLERAGLLEMPVRWPELREIEIAGAKIFVPSNQWVRAAGPVEMDLRTLALRGGDWKTATGDGRLNLPRCDITEPTRDIVVRGLEGPVWFRLGETQEPVATRSPLRVELVRVGELSARNLTAMVQVETDGEQIAADLSGPQFSGRVATTGRSQLQVRNVAVEMQGQVLCGWELLTVALDLPALLASNRIERVEIDGGRLVLWEGFDGEWNLLRLLSEEEPEEETEPQNGRSVVIDTLSIKDGKLVMGTNTIFSGLAPVTVHATLRDVDAAELESMSGEGSARLPACEVRLLEYPVTVSGLTAEAALKFGKTAGSLVAVEGEARAAKAQYKDTHVDAITASVRATENSVRAPKISADFYGSPVTGFGALQLNADPIWFSIGLEIKEVDMKRLTGAMVPDLFSAEGKSYLYLEAVGNVDEPVTWASLKFKTKGSGTVTVKDLRKLLSASNLAPDQQQLFLLAFDRGEVLPYKGAWMNADLHARKLTVATAFERQARWFMGLEVKPPPFEIPLDLLKEKGWLP